MTKIYICPTDKRYYCSWEGSADDIFQHFNEEHDDLIFFDNTINIDLTIAAENRLLIIENEIYLSQSVITDNNLLLQLRYLGPLKRANTLIYDIVLTISTDFDIEKNKYITVNNGGFVIKLDLLRQHFGFFDNITCEFNVNGHAMKSQLMNNTFEQKVPKKSQSMRERKSSMLSARKSSLDSNIKSRSIGFPTKFLEPIKENENNMLCSICQTYMVGAIYLCKFEHNICNSCKLTNKSCAVCKNIITNYRNKDLEEKSKNSLHPCKFMNIGCTIRLNYDQLTNHEINCRYCLYKCPIEECTFSNQILKFKKHIQLIHSSIKKICSLIAEFPNNSEFFLTNDEKGIFYCKSTSTLERIKWNIKFCGPDERRYFCELKFKNSKQKSPMIIKYSNSLEMYCLEVKIIDLRKLKLKDKNAILVISSYN